MNYLNALPKELAEQIKELYLQDDVDIFDVDAAQELCKKYPSYAESWVCLARLQYKSAPDEHDEYDEEDDDEEVENDESDEVFADFLKTFKHVKKEFPHYAGTLWLEVLNGFIDDSISSKESIQTALKGLKLEPQHFGLHLALADLYEREEDFKKAIYHYQECLKIFENSFRAAYGLACLYKNTNQLEQALKIAQLPHTQLYCGYAVGYNLGTILLHKEPSWAVKFFETAHQKMSSHPALLHNWAMSLQNLNDLSAAIEFWKKALQVSPDWLIPINGITRSYLKQNDFNNALQYALMGQKIDPNDFNSLWFESSIYYQQANYAKALPILEALKQKQLFTQDIEFYRLGRCYEHLGQADKAVENFHLVIEVDQEYPIGYFAIANLILEKKTKSPADLKMALAYAQAAVACNTNNEDNILKLVQAHQALDQTQEAMHELHVWLDKNGNHYSSMMAYAAMLLEQKRYKESEKFYEFIAESFEDDGDIAWGRAISYAKLQKNKKANQAIDKAIEFYKSEQNIEALARCTKVKTEIQNGGVLMRY